MAEYRITPERRRSSRLVCYSAERLAQSLRAVVDAECVRVAQVCRVRCAATSWAKADLRWREGDPGSFEGNPNEGRRRKLRGVWTVTIRPGLVERRGLLHAHALVRHELGHELGLDHPRDLGLDEKMLDSIMPHFVPDLAGWGADDAEALRAAFGESREG